MKQKVVVIGGGIAGMEATSQLSAMGYEVSLLEKENQLGGNVANWHHLFPDRKPAHDVISKLKSGIADKANVYFSADVYKVEKNNTGFNVSLTDGQQLDASALLVTTGFDVFDARKKEEYGFGIYDNVITSAMLEQTLREGKSVRTANGAVPKRIALIHCVGSRDEKAGNHYCSKVCCVTGVKQAIELKEQLPQTEIFNFYMDLRMFDRYFEDLYLEAQTKYGVNFIRGRLSEASENQDGSIVLKVEDTLAGRPLKMSVDLMVLLVGFNASKGTCDIVEKAGLKVGADRFITPLDNHAQTNNTDVNGIFVSGACTGPKSVAETLTDARSAALKVACYLNKCN
jgi:heterodisulfide reductase subunit A